MFVHLLLLNLLAGCDAGAVGGPREDADPAAIDPRSGWYAVDRGAPSYDCGAEQEEETRQGADSGLVRIDPGKLTGTFTWRDGDAEDEDACTLDGPDFTCAGYDASWHDGEATVREQGWRTGTWGSSTDFAAEETVSLTCEGEGCAELAEAWGEGFAFPCTTTVSVEGRWSEG